MSKYFVLILAALFVLSCGPSEDIVYKQGVQKQAKGMFQVIPAKMPGSENDTAELVELGKKLYFDGILSKNKEMSCNTCHRIDENKGGVDNLPTSPGVTGEPGTRNSPTVLNAGFQFAQFWDGRAKDLKEQAKGPVLNPAEMNMPDSMTVVTRIQDSPEYVAMFEKAFGSSEVTYDNVAGAIAAFERTLVTHDRFDDFLNGNVDAMSRGEVEGLDLFIKKACTTCHNGPLLGGNMFQKMGLVKPYTLSNDQGRYEVTKNESDRMMFKVPTLRNVAITGPYFHDGKVADLKEATKMMAEMQLAQTLTDEEAAKIVKFFGAMTDKEREPKM
ncbi:MAG: cytochrome-c peroxidase [Deferribacteres bacterium]|nr:cytochrome-c peroxidase [candidate division KSB1 bacterium]MCB9503910.1 cytochrome-c peroxidase [Deferribacteres bacterium]